MSDSNTSTPAPGQDQPAATSFVPYSVTRAAKVATAVETISWLLLIAAVIGGLVVAAQTGSEINSWGSAHTTHPHVVLGIGLALGGAFQCLLVIMIASYIRAKMELAQVD